MVGPGQFAEEEQQMKLIKQDLGSAIPDTSVMFVGDVLRQNLVADGDAALLRVTAVTFQNGARNRLHHHAVDQVLVVTNGYGIVATESEELHVAVGDVILITAGERHWHGAEPGQDMTHLSILTPGEIVLDEQVEG
jgi:quercetin dioxygenase-like cupin family protein